MTVIAVAQLAPVIGDPEQNRRAAAGAVGEAVSAGAELVVLPELCDSGYVFDSEQEARRLATPADDSPTLRQWQDLAAAGRTVIIGGFCELGGDGRLYNSAALVGASGTLALYRKAHLWDREGLVFTPGGAAPPVVSLPFGRVAVVICYDLEFPEWARLPALDGADLIAAPVNWPVCSSRSRTGAGPSAGSTGSAAASSSARTVTRWPGPSWPTARPCCSPIATWPGRGTSA